MSKKLIALITTVVVMLAVASPATAQRINVKTNALYWLAMSPNLGVEFRINRHMTFNLEGVVNRVSGFKPYGVSNLSTKGFAFEPEARYWFSARPQAGHFVGLTAIAANYDLQFNDKRHDGDLFGGGITYGYSFVLSRHWSLETTIGVGAVYRQEKYSRNEEERAALDKPNVSTVNFAPIKAAVSFVYIIK